MSDTVRVRIKRHYAGLNPGEIGGFTPRQAEAIVARKVGEYVRAASLPITPPLKDSEESDNKVTEDGGGESRAVRGRRTRARPSAAHSK